MYVAEGVLVYQIRSHGMYHQLEVCVRLASGREERE